MMETHAIELLKRKEWTRALDVYDRLVSTERTDRHRLLALLPKRTECLLALGRLEAAADDCRRLVGLTEATDEEQRSQARIRLVYICIVLGNHQEIELTINDWLNEIRHTNHQRLELIHFLEDFLERYRTLSIERKLDLWFNHSQTIPRRLEPSTPHLCVYCNLSFINRMELRRHCQSDAHEMMIMSDDGHDWRWRAPPRGIKPADYVLCENWKEEGCCRYGLRCVDAHGDEELNEWRERFQYREMRLLRARDKELYGKSYTEELLEKWSQSTTPNLVIRDRVEQIEDSCTTPLSVTVSTKNSQHEWIFHLKCANPLKAVALLQDNHRSHFRLRSVIFGELMYEVVNDQEWLAPAILPNLNVYEYAVCVGFHTNIFGTFRQTVTFDCGTEPVLVKHLCVDVVPPSDIEKINEIRKEVSVSIAERWTNSNARIIPFQSTLVSTYSEWENELKTLYPCPDVGSFTLSHSTMTEKKFTRNNYRSRMHELLYVEEMERYSLISQYNLTTKMQITHSYILSPNSTAASTAKYSSNGELFASIRLGKELSEDTSEGRLILMHCNSVYLHFKVEELKNGEVPTVYEAPIEDKGKNIIYLRLSSRTVADLRLTSDSDFEARIQFQLNRIPYCEWHYTMDKISDFKMIFPETYLEPNIPWSPSRQWSNSFDSRLNPKQKEAIVAITTPLHIRLPPILVIGPFGTGKTFTLAQAVKELIKDERNRILLCTHSNSAADLYIKDYLDVWVTAGNENARPLRIYYEKRWVATVSPVVQKYCLIRTEANARSFQIPTVEDIEKHRIVVVTLSTSVYLSAIGLTNGYFTHILLDEAAQAIECEAITPLALANDSTRIVLAGDHMQLGPDIFSRFTRERNLHISLLERLYDLYPVQFPCKILLCENYRAHETIIQFTSESFYDQKLIASSRQPKHDRFHPLTFFTTRGEDVQDKNSTAFYNNSEVYEVVERVAELKKNWPKDWGAFDEHSIGVVTPYVDQVFRIRSELRKRRVDQVCVERVLNVQGKQFRAIFLSTVRTRRTCTNQKDNSNVDYGFLSNSKLLNTAITRAQSLVAVVGDPIALCSLGRCSKVWERFLQICEENSSLFGMQWSQLRLQLDGIELKKIYTLNPLAPEFIPRRYKEIVPRLQENAMRGPIVYSPMPAYVPVPMVPLVYRQQRPVLLNPPFITNGYRPMRVVPPPPPPPPHAPRHPAYYRPTLVPIPHNSKLIQFMSNVHFPEAQMLNDCINLLPQRMSLAEMIMQPASVQERWYTHLKSTSGIEAAEKFRYLLQTTNRKSTRPTPKTNIFGRTTPVCDSPTYNWYDSPSDQINFSKPIYLRERKERCDDVQRHINEDFANMSLENGPNDELFRAFASDRSESGSSSEGGSKPRFYKYFS